MALNILVLLVIIELVLSQVNNTTTEENDGVQLYPVILPFEMNNPSQVAGVELFEYDMLLTEQQKKDRRKAVPDEDYRWTEGSDGYPLVPYIFVDSVNQDDVKAGLNHWMEHTCIKFEETSNTSQPHLKFHIGVGCWSYVGMLYFQNGQDVSIGSGCNSLSIVVHEVGHAMGFYHEQSRSDRDDYVTILFDNIEVNDTSQFEKRVDNNYSVPYDYTSNMHYGIYFFSKNDKRTIITKDLSATELIGSRNGLTHRDKLLANRIYNCTGKWLSKCGISSDPCLNDGYTGINCTCICPPGTNGSNCEEIVDDYYAQARSPLSEKITSEKTITIKSPLEPGAKFVTWIVPPSCKKAKLIFTSSNMFDVCDSQYLYVKTESSNTIGQTLCAANVTTGVTLTSDTGIYITMYSNVNYGFVSTIWEADVTFDNIIGCSATDPPTQPSSPAPTPTPTPAPTNPSTPPPTTPPTPASTIPPAPDVACQKWPTKTITSEDTVGNIGCGWNVKAPEKGSLTITCDKIELNGNNTIFGGQNEPSLTLRKVSFKLNLHSGSE